MMLVKNRCKYFVVTVYLLILIISNSTSAISAEKLTIAHCMPENHPYHLSLLEFDRLLLEKTNGRYELIIYPQEQMGTEQQVTELCSAGAMDFTCVWDGAYEQYIPLLGLLQLPYLFENWNHYWAVMDGEIGKELYSGMREFNIEVLSAYVNGEHSIISRFPVEKPTDLKGKKGRVATGEISIKYFEVLGAIGTPISFGEVYTALQLGTVDFLQQYPVTIYNSKFHEIAPYFCETLTMYANQSIAINTNVMESLPEDVQKAIREAAYESALFNRDYTYKSIIESKELMIQEGATIVIPEREEWIKQATPVYEYFFKKYPEWENVVKRIKAVEY